MFHQPYNTAFEKEDRYAENRTDDILPDTRQCSRTQIIFTKVYKNVPIMAPIIVPRPPTATQITIVMEKAIVI